MFILYFCFCANLQSALGFVFCSFALCFYSYLSTMPRKTRAHRTTSTSSESRGWFPLLEIDYPPLTALIREFYSNLSCHIYDSNTLVRSWIWGIEFTITPRVVAEALRVPVVWDAVYPYDKSPSLDVVMSYITGSSIQWVLILGSRPLSLPRLPIFSFGLRVIPCGLSLTSTPSL